MFLRRTNLLNRRSLPPHASAGVIDRPRLTRMADFLVRHRLALVHAPAGSGKTTLLAQWHDAVQGAGIATAWYSASDDDKDPLSLADYLLLAIEQTTGFSGEFIPAGDAGEGIRRLVETVTALTLQRSLVLFLDDYHRVDGQDAGETISALLAARLPNMTIVLSSRNRPSLTVGRYRANGELIELSVEDLQFDDLEAEDFFRIASGGPLSSDESRQMREHTEGWAAGLRLASLVLGRTGGDFMATAPAGSHRAFADYFMEEVIAGLPEDICDFLAKTSILETFNAELCDAVTERHDAIATLAALEAAQLFIVALPSAQPWYKYHHLFQEFLQTRLYAAGSDKVSAVHARAAHWFITNGSPFEAVRHAFLAQQPKWAAELIESYCLYDYLSHGRFETYSHWMQQLPRDSREERPLLMFLLVWRYINMRRFLQAEQTLHAIETAARDPDSRLSAIARATGVDIDGRLHLMRALIGAYGGDLARGAGHIAALGDKQLDRLAFGQVDLDSIHSYLAYQEGDLERAERLTFRAKGVYDEMACHWGGIHSRCIAAMSYLTRGWTDEAETVLTDALATAKKHFADSSYMVALPSALLGTVAFRRGDLHVAEELWLHAMPSETSTNVSGLCERVLIATLGLARLYDLTGRSDAATSFLVRASRRAYEIEDFRLEFQLAIERTDRALRLDNPAEGRRERDRLGMQLDEARKRFPPSAWQIWDCFSIAEARLMAAAGDISGAINKLEHLSATMRDQRRLVQALEAEALAAMLRSRIDASGAFGETLPAIMVEAKAIRLENALADFLDPRRSTYMTEIKKVVGRTGRSAELTSREAAVLELLQWGLTNQDIATKLGINLNTVKSHVKNIFEKLNVKSRTQAVLLTLEK